MLTRDDKAGLYLTVIVHLVILIILLIAQLGFSLSKENTFLVDFSKVDEPKEERQNRKADGDDDRSMDDIVAEKVARMLAGTSGTEFRNLTSSRNKGALKDDRHTDADKLYADAERLAKELKSGVKIEPDDDYVATSAKDASNETPEIKPYSGPSVLSWHLDNRKASRLPIPAYRCYSGGMVTVVITVNTAGKVIDARVLDDVSSQDKCLRDFAVRAARMSLFSANPSAPSKQVGDIVYQFLAQ